MNKDKIITLVRNKIVDEIYYGDNKFQSEDAAFDFADDLLKELFPLIGIERNGKLKVLMKLHGSSKVSSDFLANEKLEYESATWENISHLSRDEEEKYREKLLDDGYTVRTYDYTP